MANQNYFNDAPIQTPEDDRFGIDAFAQALAQSITNIDSPVGVTIALNGSWGSGKSSAINLIRHHLGTSEKAGSLKIIDFKSWWFRGEEALTLAFLQEINATLAETADAKKLVPRLSRILLRASPVLGPAVNVATGGSWGVLVSRSMDFVQTFFPEESVEEIFAQLSESLREQDRRYLVIIDDLDRLLPDEALLVFRLLKSVGRLPNIIYLLAFDRNQAERSVARRYPSEGPHFLEKIVQASFDIPSPTQNDLNGAVLAEIEERCGSSKDESELLRFMNVFYDAVSPYIKSPRDVTRLSNMMAVSWPPVADQVDKADFVALEVMRLFETSLYNSIRNLKDQICGTRSSYDEKEKPEVLLERLLGPLPEARRQTASTALERLFPRFENTRYSDGTLEQWEAQRRVCAERHFDSYFRMTIGEDTLRSEEIEELVQGAGNAEFIKDKFRRASLSIRKSGTSKVPILLEELTIHSIRIEEEHIQPLVTAIFEIADDINRPEDEDRGILGIGDNYLRIHWLIRKLTLHRFDSADRSGLFLRACEDAQLGWLIDFVSSALDEHNPRADGSSSRPAEMCLVDESHTARLKGMALGAIEAAVNDDDLLDHPRLPYILFRWRDLCEDNPADLTAWVSEQLLNDVGVAKLAKAFTSESWSQSVGDRVSMKKVGAAVDSLGDLMDLAVFRSRLEELEQTDRIDPQLQTDVSVFLKAWRNKEQDKSRRASS